MSVRLHTEVRKSQISTVRLWLTLACLGTDRWWQKGERKEIFKAGKGVKVEVLGVKNDYAKIVIACLIGFLTLLRVKRGERAPLK